MIFFSFQATGCIILRLRKINVYMANDLYKLTSF